MLYVVTVDGSLVNLSQVECLQVVPVCPKRTDHNGDHAEAGYDEPHHVVAKFSGRALYLHTTTNHADAQAWLETLHNTLREQGAAL